MKRTLAKVTFFAAVLMMLGGCATVEQVNEARALAESAQAAANAAAAAADSATAAANQAADAASAAQAAADAANACCSENSSKLDRMFEKAMQK